MACVQSFHFYTQFLELLSNVKFNSIIDGLIGNKGVSQFNPLTLTENTEYVLMTKLDDEKHYQMIEA